MDLDSLDLKRLRAFHLVAKHGNLRLAALRLNQTIPAVSSKLKRLEEGLGVTLFERLPNRLMLTKVGEQFLHEVEALFERAQQAVATLAPASAPAGRIFISTGVDHSWYFAPRISRFLKRYPGAELSLQVSLARDALRALMRGDLDLSVGIFPKVPKTLGQEVIVETTLSLVCKPGHPLLRRQPPAAGDVARATLIVPPGYSDTRKLVDKAFANSAVKPKSVVEVASCQTASTFVEMGVGVAIVHSLCIGHLHPPTVRWVGLGKEFGKIPFSVVYRRGALRSPLIRALLEELSSQ